MKILRYLLLTATVALTAGVTVAQPAGAEAPRVSEAVAQPVVKVVRGHVEIHLPGDESRQVQVYALTGQLVKTVEVQPGVTVLELPAGYYIVKCDRLSQRVIVRS